MKLAAIFPGQGAQKPGMGRDFYDNFSRAREMFDEADDILGEKFSDTIFNGETKTLALTRNSQLAIFITSVAIFEVLKEQVPEIEFVMMGGLSLGEYSALYASGRMSFPNALKLVARRGQLMQEAAQNNPGTMAAVIGVGADQIMPYLSNGVNIANLNCPGQIVISGTVPGIDQTVAALKSAGIGRIVPLDVSGAFHSNLMESARLGLSSDINDVTLEKSNIDLVMNVPGDFVSEESEIRENLIAQVVGSVKWESCVRAMMGAGAQCFVEIGPGKTLNGMNRKIGAGKTISLEMVSHLDSLLIEVAK